jgi:hypothetical protein
MGEICELNLAWANVVTNVLISKKEEKGRASSFTATADIRPGMNVTTFGKNPEEALRYLKAGVISQYAPNYKEDGEFLNLPVNLMGATGEIIMKLGRFYVNVPKSIDQRSPCGCSVVSTLSVTNDGENGGVEVESEFYYCVTHKQAYAMRRLLELEKAVALDWMSCGDINTRALIAATERVLDIEKALGDPQ